MTRPLIDRIDFRSLFSADAMRIAESAYRKQTATMDAAGKVSRRFVATAKTATELQIETIQRFESMLLDAMLDKRWTQVETLARSLAALDRGAPMPPSDLSNRLDDL